MHFRQSHWKKLVRGAINFDIPLSEIFHVGLIFIELATSLKSPKTNTAKNKPYFTSSLRVL